MRVVLPNHSSPAHWSQLYGCSTAYSIAQLLADNRASVLLLVADASALAQIEDELRFFCPDDLPIIGFPDWEMLPYDRLSPHKDLSAERLKTLSHLPHFTYGICIATIPSLLQRLPPQDFISKHTFDLRCDDQINIEAFQRRLSEIGYERVSQVYNPGDYAVRGSIIDFFPAGSNHPVRMDLFDDRIETLRFFEPGTQLSKESLESISVLPSQEYPFTKQAIESFRTRFRAEFNQNPTESHVYREVSRGIVPDGIEYYSPLFFEESVNLLGYIDQNSVIIYDETIDDDIKKYRSYVSDRYEQLKGDPYWPLLDVSRLYCTHDEIGQGLEKFGRIQLSRFGADTGDAAYRPLPPVALDASLQEPTRKLCDFINSFDGRILFTSQSASYREQIIKLLADLKIKPRSVDNWRQFIADECKIAICPGGLHDGMTLLRQKIALVPDHKILGQHIAQQKRDARRTRNAELVIKNINDLETACPVVHEQHGIGRFLGLEILEVSGTVSEFCVIEYADNDKLYVPITALHLLSRYAVGDATDAPLHKLGAKQWDAAKRKAAQKAADIAAELLDTQARRRTLRGFRFQTDSPEYHLFASTFPYEETADQKKAIEEILSDMRSSKPMDRIICGDVGFGKTEVAMRAMFIAAHNGYQVAVLTPTTLLARQHFETFHNRFSDYPVRVEMLSRFNTPRSRKHTIAGIKDGSVDIVVGTHKLLQNNIRFRRLALIVIDEEHRFGVKNKEKIKSLYAKTDVLMLTATPIPRTLNMSLNKLRDITIISTPPARRHAIKTFVKQWDEALIREACQREIHRGGQIYFVHNRIETIDDIVECLQDLLPEARISTAHGAMHEHALEKSMLDFYSLKSNILVCTTIIENGIDIPTANTMIINRADHFGLAQLHQLRGRIGRSHHSAYAYMLIPPKAYLTTDAARRLEAIEALKDLGVGLTLALQDLEIRGAGELLGKEQSGHIHTVGFAMYNRLLKRAIKVLKTNEDFDIDKPLDTVTEIDLGEPALIPDDYLPDVNLRLILYRKIATLKDKRALREMEFEMQDRFGKLPPYLLNLFKNTSLRIQCRKVGIAEVKKTLDGLKVRFDNEAKIDTDKLLSIVSEEPENYRFFGNRSLLLKDRDKETVESLDSKLIRFIELIRV